MEMELEKKSRKQLQQLSKKHSIPANLASVELIARLKLVLQVEEKVLKKVSKSAPKKVTFKLDRGHDNKDLVVVEDSSGGNMLSNNIKARKGGCSRNEVRDVSDSDVEVVAEEVVPVRSTRSRGGKLVVKDVLPVRNTSSRGDKSVASEVDVSAGRMRDKRNRSGTDIPDVAVNGQEFVEEAALIPARSTRLVGGNPVTVVVSSAEKIVMLTRRSTRGRATVETVNVEVVSVDSPSPVVIRGRRGAKAQNCLAVVEHVETSEVLEEALDAPMRKTRDRARGSTGSELVNYKQPPAGKKIRVGVKAKSNVGSILEMVHVGTSKVPEKVPVVPVRTTRARARASVGSELVNNEQPPVSKKARKGAESKSNVETSQEIAVHVGTSKILEEVPEVPVRSTRAQTRGSTGSELVVHELPPVSKKVRRGVEAECNVVSIPARMTRARYSMVPSVDQEKVIVFSPPVTKKKAGKSESKEHVVKQKSFHIVEDSLKITSRDVTIVESKVETNATDTLFPKDKTTKRHRYALGDLKSSQTVNLSLPGQPRKSGRSSIEESTRNVSRIETTISNDGLTGPDGTCRNDSPKTKRGLMQRKFSAGITQNEGENGSLDEPKTIRQINSAGGKGQGQAVCIQVAEDAESRELGENSQHILSTIKEVPDEACDDLGSRGLVMKRNIVHTVSDVKSPQPDNSTVSVSDCVFSESPTRPHLQQSDIPLSKNYSVEICNNDIGRNHETTNIVVVTSNTFKLDTGNGSQLCHLKDSTEKVVQGENTYDLEKPLNSTVEQLVESEDTEKLDILGKSVDITSQVQTEISEPHYVSVDRFVGESTRLQSSRSQLKHDSIEAGDNDVRKKHEDTDILKVASVTSESDAEKGTNMCQLEENTLEVAQGKNIYNSEKESLGKAEEGHSESVNVENDLNMHHKDVDLEEAAQNENMYESEEEPLKKTEECELENILVCSIGGPSQEQEYFSEPPLVHSVDDVVRGTVHLESNFPCSKNDSIDRGGNVGNIDSETADLVTHAIDSFESDVQDGISMYHPKYKIKEVSQDRSTSDLEGEPLKEIVEVEEKCRDLTEKVEVEECDTGSLDEYNTETGGHAALSPLVKSPATNQTRNIGEVDCEDTGVSTFTTPVLSEAEVLGVEQNVQSSVMKSLAKYQIRNMSEEDCNFAGLFGLCGIFTTPAVSKDAVGDKGKEDRGVFEEESGRQLMKVEGFLDAEDFSSHGESTQSSAQFVPLKIAEDTGCLESAMNHENICTAELSVEDYIVISSELKNCQVSEVEIFGPAQQGNVKELDTAEPEAQDDYLDYLDIPETSEPDEAYIGNSSVSGSLPASETVQVLVDSSNQATENNYEFSFNKNDLLDIESAPQYTPQATFVNKELYRSNEHGLHEYSLEEAGVSSFLSPQSLLVLNNRYEILAGLETSIKTNVGCSLKNPGNVDRVEGKEAKNNEQSSPNNFFLSPPSLLPTKNRFDILTGLDTALKTNVGRRLKNTGNDDSLEGQDGDKDFRL